MQFTKTLLALVSISAVGLSAPTNYNGTFSGDATFYYPGLGACGDTNSDSDLVVALSTSQYGSGNHCFDYISILYQDKYVKAQIVDKCPGCGPNDVDISPTAFSCLAEQALGRIQVTWNFL